MAPHSGVPNGRFIAAQGVVHTADQCSPASSSVRLANRFRLPLPQFMYNTTLNTLAALNAYCPQPLPLRLTLIRAQDTREMPGASAACGWEQVPMHEVEALWAPGDHETMFPGEKLEATTELVRRCWRHEGLDGMAALATSPTLSQTDGRLLRVGSL
jgi:hypothetical protein